MKEILSDEYETDPDHLVCLMLFAKMESIWEYAE
jgi:hypothetical protein